MVLSEADVTIKLLDSNDNSPVFVTSPVVFSVSEDANIGDVVGVLNVSILLNKIIFIVQLVIYKKNFDRPQMLTVGQTKTLFTD